MKSRVTPKWSYNTIHKNLRNLIENKNLHPKPCPSTTHYPKLWNLGVDFAQIWNRNRNTTCNICMLSKKRSVSDLELNPTVASLQFGSSMAFVFDFLYLYLCLNYWFSYYIKITYIITPLHSQFSAFMAKILVGILEEFL